MFESHALQLTIARVDEPVFTGPVHSVSVPGVDGMMELMANHTPLVSTLTAGVITVHPEEGDDISITIESGTLEVAHNQATILI